MVKGSPPMKLNVKVEVEECTEDTDQNLIEEVKLDNKMEMSLKDEPLVKKGNEDDESSSNITADSEDDDGSQLSMSTLDDDARDVIKKGKSCQSLTNRVSVEVKQKIEDEEYFEDDIIVLAQNAAEEMAMTSQAEVPIKKEVTPQPKLKQPKNSESLKSPKATSKKLIKCSRCDFEGSDYECANHLSQCKASYVCTKCNLKFISIEGYVYHFQEHGLSPDYCPVCEEVVAKRFHLHLQRHIKLSFSKMQLMDTKDDKVNIDLMYRCNKCKKSVEVESLFEHWEGHLNLDKTIPTTSEETVKKKHSSLDPQLLQKIKIILTKKITNSMYSCIICKCGFHRNNDVKRHLIEHLLSDAMCRYNKMRGLECQFCFHILRKSNMFRWHMREHASLPVHKCEVCCKTFSDPSNFTKHRKRHNLHLKECDECPKKFLSDDKLKKHKLVHNKTKTGLIFCAICDMTCSEESELRRHMKVKHGGRIFTCPLCKIKFDSWRLKCEHMWDVHKQSNYEADCPICRKSFRNNQDVRDHLRDVHKRKSTLLNKNMVKMLPQMLNEHSGDDIAENSTHTTK